MGDGDIFKVILLSLFIILTFLFIDLAAPSGSLIRMAILVKLRLAHNMPPLIFVV